MSDTNTSTPQNDTNPNKNFKNAFWVILIVLAIFFADRFTTHFISGGTQTADSTLVATPVDTIKAVGIADTTKKDTIAKVVVADTTKKEVKK